MHDCAIREFDYFIRVLMEHSKCINIVIKFGGLKNNNKFIIINYIFISSWDMPYMHASCILCIFPDIMHDHMHCIGCLVCTNN